MKKTAALFLALTMLAILVSCSRKPAAPDAVSSPDPAPAADPAPVTAPASEADPTPADPGPEPPAGAPDPLPEWLKVRLTAPKHTTNDEYNFYDFDGFTVRIANVYADLMTVGTPGWTDGIGETLITFAETASVEQAERDYPGEDTGFGWLGAVVRLDQLDFERWLCSEQTGTYLFARSGKGFYYLLALPTDVRVYRSDGNYDYENIEDWGALCDWIAGTLPNDLIELNGLEAYDASEYYDRGATYDQGESLTYAVRPENEMIESITFVLSQPAQQGEGGIWCVDRYYVAWKPNEYNGYQQVDTMLNFPVAEGIAQPADVYWPWLQKCELSPEHQARLDPEAVALAFTKTENWYYGSVTEDMLERSYG